MYIEVLVVIVLMVVFIIWRLWFMYSKWRLKRKYKPENDKTRKGGVKGAVIRKAEPGIVPAVDDSVGYAQLERREFLPPTDTDNVGKDSSSSRENSSGIRKLLGRTKKKWMKKL